MLPLPGNRDRGKRREEVEVVTVKNWSVVFIKAQDLSELSVSSRNTTSGVKTVKVSCVSPPADIVQNEAHGSR